MPTLIGLSDTSNGYPRGNTGFFFKRFLATIVEEGLAILKGLFLQAFFFALIFRDYPGYFTAFYEIMPDLYINAFFLSISSRI